MNTETSIFENLNAAELEAIKAGKSEVVSESMDDAEAMGDGLALSCCNDTPPVRD